MGSEYLLHVLIFPQITHKWLCGQTVRMLDLRSRSRGREFHSKSGCYQVVTTWMGDCLRTGKPSRYITYHQDQLSLPSRHDKLSNGVLGQG